MLIREASATISLIDKIIDDINNELPVGTYKIDKLRSELAGLIIVSYVASYENCIKAAMIDYATSHNRQFGYFAEKEYEKLNSKIELNSLFKYANKLGCDVKNNFCNELTKCENRLYPMQNLGRKYDKFQIVRVYHDLLQKRHAFAHARINNTTIMDAQKMNKIAKFVVLTFIKALKNNGQS